jgi:hypothetical protein
VPDVFHAQDNMHQLSCNEIARIALSERTLQSRGRGFGFV